MYALTRFHCTPERCYCNSFGYLHPETLSNPFSGDLDQLITGSGNKRDANLLFVPDILNGVQIGGMLRLIKSLYPVTFNQLLNHSRSIGQLIAALSGKIAPDS